MAVRSPFALASLLLLPAVASCSGDPGASATSRSGGIPSPFASRCAADNGGITLPEGFCAFLVVDSLPGTRHLEVAPNGDIFVARRNWRTSHDMFPDLFTVDQNAEKPSEELVRIDAGSDFGWPYCYMPIIGFPAHWAPNDLAFYGGSQFPEAYRGGAFIAFHGSWNRAPRPQDGYRVVFVPRSADGPGTEWQVFADGFRREGGDAGSVARPVGLAVGPDGSLFISDSFRGRIWRAVYGEP